MHCSKTHTKHRETRDMTPGSAICACSEQKKTFFTVSVIKQVTQRGCGVVILEEIQPMTGPNLWQLVLGNPAWPGELDQISPDLSFCLKTSD